MKKEKLKMILFEIIRKTFFFIKFPFPFTYWTKYKSNNKHYMSIWRQWFGIVFNYMCVEIKK